MTRVDRTPAGKREPPVARAPGTVEQRAAGAGVEAAEEQRAAEAAARPVTVMTAATPATAAAPAGKPDMAVAAAVDDRR